MSVLSWKGMFYDLVLPALRSRDAEAADAWLAALGRGVARAWRPWLSRLRSARERATDVVGHPLGRGFVGELGEQAARGLARDYMLEGLDDRECDARFDVEGFEHVVAGLSSGRGLILVGSHFGAYLPALHWLYRQDLPLRSMLQRPTHMSETLRRHLDEAHGRHPQGPLLLRRGLDASAGIGALMSARAVLRDGMALYVCGDIPWPTGRRVNWLGRRWGLLDHWAQLGAATGSEVVSVVGFHRPGGRFLLRFSSMRRGCEVGVEAMVGRYLKRLEAAVCEEPAQAVAYWTWRSYELPSEREDAALRVERRRRIVAPASAAAR